MTDCLTSEAGQFLNEFLETFINKLFFDINMKIVY